MSGYFKPRRRKLGVATLVMALLLMVAFIRGHFILDFFYFSKATPSQNSIILAQPGIAWRKTESLQPNVNMGAVAYWESIPASKWDQLDLFSMRSLFSKVDWQWKLWGFHFGEARDEKNSMRESFCLIPYWSVALPLALLSAWLLLSKSRVKKPAT